MPKQPLPTPAAFADKPYAHIRGHYRTAGVPVTKTTDGGQHG